MKQHEIEKINSAFEELQQMGLLRFRIVPDETFYDDSYVDTWEISESDKIKAKKEIRERIEEEGVWGIAVDKKCSECGQWDEVDSVYGFIGNEYEGSGYDIDVKISGLKSVAQHNVTSELHAKKEV